MSFTAAATDASRAAALRAAFRGDVIVSAPFGWTGRMDSRAVRPVNAGRLSPPLPALEILAVERSALRPDHAQHYRCAEPLVIVGGLADRDDG